MERVVFVARLSNPASHAVFEKIRDWSLTGMVSESLWVDIDEPTEMIRVNGADVATFKTDAWAATEIKAGEQFKIFPIQVMKSPSSAMTREELTKAFAGSPIFTENLNRSVNLIFPVAETDAAQELYFPQNLNIVVIPVDGYSPDGGTVELNKKSPQYFSNVAKEVVTIGGLWPGMESSPVLQNNYRIGTPANVALVRSFVRYVDASIFVRSIVNRVLEGKDGALPVARDLNSGTVLNEVSGANAQQAAQLVSAQFMENQDLLKFNQYPKNPPQKPKADGLWSLIKYYARWLWAWLRRQPGDIVRKAWYKQKERVAARAQKLFGDQSQFMVMVGGVSAHKYADGIPQPADEILARVQIQLDSPALPEPAAPANIWRNMVEIATSLIDGGPVAAQQITMPSIGISRTVITNAAMVAPSPFDKPFNIPATLNIPYAGHKITTSDPLAAKLLHEKLENGSPSNGAAHEMNALAKLNLELTEWMSSQKSFIWSIGDAISTNLLSALKAWESLNQKPSEIDENNLIAAEEKAQKSLARLFKGTLTIILGALGLWIGQAIFINIAFGAWPAIAPWWPIAAGVAGILFVLWNIIGMLLVKNDVQELFRIQHQMNFSEDRQKFAVEAQKHIWQEISRLTTYYKQWQAWSSIMSAFIHKQDSKETKSKQNDLIGGAMGLPQSMSIARLAPATDSSAKNLLDEISSKFYQPGWLMQLVRGVVDEKIGQFDTVITDSMASSNSPLGKTLTWVSGDEVFDSIRDIAGDRVEKLATDGDAFSSWSVETTSAIGDKKTSNGTQFIGELGQGAPSLPATNLLNAAGAVAGLASIDRSLSAMAVDTRIQITGDLSRNIPISQNLAESRELDFLGVRFESTSLIEKSTVKLFAVAKQQETIVENIEEGPQG